jgi:hypothetical protein
MTLRIDQRDAEDGVTVQLHGWLHGAAVAEFEAVCGAAGGILHIDLSQLAGADAEGLRALRKSRRTGARLEHATPHMALLIEASAKAFPEEQ